MQLGIRSGLQRAGRCGLPETAAEGTACGKAGTQEQRHLGVDPAYLVHTGLRAEVHEAKKMGMGGIGSRGPDTPPFLQEASGASSVCQVEHLPSDGSSLEEKISKIPAPKDVTSW